MPQDDRHLMDPKALKQLDSLFGAFEIVAEGAYVYLCDMHYDLSRWSTTAVDFFDLPGEYMAKAGDIWEDHIHPDDRESFHRSIDNIFSGNESGHDMQYRARTRDGSYVVCTCRGVIMRDAEGKPHYFGGAITNHGIRSHIDHLTGLRNQYGFFEDLNTVLQRRRKTMFLMLGLNKFSQINNTYGYEIGNRVLQTVGRELMQRVANRGMVFRLDGARFLVQSQTMAGYEAEDFCADLRDKFRQDYSVDGRKLMLDFSAALLVLDSFDADGQTVYSCLCHAYDESKYRRQGALVSFHNRMDDSQRDTFERLSEIRNCIGGDFKGFYLCYQPVVDAVTERIKGAEALLRWHNDKYGEVPPNDFIGVLEQDSKFPDLGLWILEKALLDSKEIMKTLPSFIINVNVSYAQFSRPDFADQVIEILRRVDYPGDHLCLEITERCRLLDLDMLQHTMVRLRQEGILFALDDFGTGFSSLNILKKLTVDVVKIDRGFVMNIEDDVRDQETVRYVSKLAAVYGAEVCAEGIETPSMRDFLRQYSVRSLQGYLYSRPVPYDKFREYQKRNQHLHPEA